MGNAASHIRGLPVDVVIPTFDGWPLLERCLTLLRVQTRPHNVIVVDNGSGDSTVERTARAFPDVMIVALPTNVGFPSACNRGAAAGTGDVIVLLNNDVEPRADFLDRLVVQLEHDGRLGSVAALLTLSDRTRIDSVGLAVDRTLAGFPRLRGLPTAAGTATDPVLAGPAGGAGAYRRTAWESVGGLDEGVVGYGEDVDLALRLRGAGWETAAAPEAIAVHLGSASFGRRSAWQRYQSGFARGYFVRRYRVLETRAAMRAIATEVAVVTADAAISRDLSALRGRVAGYRAARNVTRREYPPAFALDPTISLVESIRLRRVVYST